jgi:hypothetical protein
VCLPNTGGLVLWIAIEASSHFSFPFLFVMIILQVLSMVQADRLYERLNHLLEVQKHTDAVRNMQIQ